MEKYYYLCPKVIYTIEQEYEDYFLFNDDLIMRKTKELTEGDTYIMGNHINAIKGFYYNLINKLDIYTGGVLNKDKSILERYHMYNNNINLFEYTRTLVDEKGHIIGDSTSAYTSKLLKQYRSKGSKTKFVSDGILDWGYKFNLATKSIELRSDEVFYLFYPLPSLYKAIRFW